MDYEQLIIDAKEPMLLDFFKDLQSDMRPMDLKAIEALEELIEDESLFGGSVPGADNFRGVIFIKIYPEGDIKITHKNKVITQHDKKILSDWIMSRNHKKYADEFYRIDFENYIFMFKIYKFNKNIVFAGHMLDNNPVAKIDLLSFRQDVLRIQLRSVNHG